MKIENLKTDCQHFLGYIPCKPHKDYGVHCVENDGNICKYYSPIGKKILIIKLGAAGDVIRTTPLLYPLRKKYNLAHITWLTHFPDLVPSKNDNENGVDLILNYDEKSISVIRNSEYDLIINLDKDAYACSLVKEKNNTKEIYGYTLVNNKPFPVNELAIPKYITGIFDDISKENTKSYLEELFEICGFVFNKEEYILPKFEKAEDINIDSSKKIVGLNTGCGGRWTSRLWPFDYWLELIELLKKNSYEVVLLGGPEEHEKNLSLQAKTGAKYFGVQPLKKFIGLMNEVDVVVSAVTMAMHIAIGLKKQLVLMNNIFNKNEFELYNRGVIVEPEKECKCYFRPTCSNDEYKCIDYIYPQKIFDAIKSLE
jgi:heptosyltransferase-2